MAGAQLSQLAMTTVDVAYVGRLHEGALAAMAVGQASYSFFMAIGIGLAAAVSPLSAQAHGAGHHDQAARPVGVGIWFALVYGLFSWGALYSIDQLYLALDYPPAVIEQATVYVRSMMLGLPAFFIYLCAKNYLDSTGRPRLPFLVAFVAVAFNAVLAYGLVFGRLGLPDLGVAGVGYATSTINLGMAVVLLLLVGRPALPSFLSPTRGEIAEFLTVGLPVAGSILLEIGLFVGSALLMGQLGTQEAAAHQVAITCSSSTFMIPLGISFAGAARVGHAVGAGQLERVRAAGLAAMGVGVVCMSVSGALFALFPGPLVEIFWNPEGDGGQVRVMAMQLLLIAAALQVFDGLQVTANGALRGMKDVKVPLLIAALAYWGVGWNVARYLAFETPLRHQGVWIGLLTGLACAGLGLSLRFLVQSRRLETPGTETVPQE